MADIDRLLICRYAIEAYREAHKNLHAKPWHSTIPDEHTPIFAQLKDTLAQQGFDSVDAIFVFNKQMCLRELTRCYQLVGVCDSCEGRPVGCVRSCYQNWETTTNAKPSGIGPGIDGLTTGAILFWKYNPGCCPPGCAMHMEKILEPDFDWIWSD